MPSIILTLFAFGSCRKAPDTAHSGAKQNIQELRSENVTVSNLNDADTKTVHRLTRQGYQLSKKSPDSAVTLYQDALKLALRTGYFEGAAMNSTNLNLLYAEQNKYVEADYYRMRFLEQLKKIPSRFFNAADPRHIWLTQHRDFERALSHFTAGEVDTATVLYLDLLSHLGTDDAENYKLLSWSYAALGAIRYKFGDTGRAAQYFETMRSLGEKYADSAILVQALTNQATFLENSKQHKKALIAAQAALHVAEKINNQKLEGSNMHLIAHALIGLGKADSALAYSQLRLQLSQKIGSGEANMEAYELLGYNYNQLGQYALAEAALRNAYDLTVVNRYFLQMHRIHFQLAEAYEGQGKYKLALDYYKRYSERKDSLLSTENAKNIAETESRYQVAEKDKKLALQELRIARQQKNLYLWIGGGVCCVALLGGLLRRKQQKTKIEKLQARLAGEEQERARMARELHDGIVSRLSVIKTSFSALPQYYRGDPEASALQDAVRQLDQSIVELRSTSHNLMPEVLKRDGLVESVRSYCEKVSQIDSLMVRFQLVGSLPPLSDAFQLNVYRIIQELLQNILKHSRATRALVQFNVQEDQLDITVEDNGPQQVMQSSAKPAGQTLDTQGIGWMNLTDRVKLLEGQLELEQNGVTAIYLTFPLKKHQVHAS